MVLRWCWCIFLSFTHFYAIFFSIFKLWKSVSLYFVGVYASSFHVRRNSLWNYLANLQGHWCILRDVNVVLSLRSPKEPILLIKFLLMSLIVRLTPITSCLFLFLTHFIIRLAVDWVHIVWIGILTKYLPILIILIFVKLAIILFFLGANHIIIAFYLVCLMMLQDPLLSFFFFWIWLQPLLPLVKSK